MKVKTIKAATSAQLEDELAQCLSDDFQPTLAFLFLSIEQDHAAISRLFDSKGMTIFGATTAGEFIDGDVEDGAIAAMLLELNPAYFQLKFVEIGENNLADLAAQIGREGIEAFANPAFILSYSGLYTDGELLVKEIDNAVGGRSAIFGGMAGDNLTFVGPVVFTNKKESNKAIICLVIDGDKIALKGHATSGWKPVGTERTVTSSKGSEVYTIDGEPALEVVLKFFGVNTESPEEKKERLAQLSATFTILLQREGGDPVARTAMFGNLEDDGVKFSGNVPQGSKFRFSLPPDFDVVDKVIADSDEIKQTQLPEADALILFSCISRHLSLGPMVGDEIDGLKKVWNAPLIGFFSYGEIGKATNGKQEFHNNTCCFVAMKEKQPQ